MPLVDSYNFSRAGPHSIAGKLVCIAKMSKKSTVNSSEIAFATPKFNSPRVQCLACLSPRAPQGSTISMPMVQDRIVTSTDAGLTKVNKGSDVGPGRAQSFRLFAYTSAASWKSNIYIGKWSEMQVRHVLECEPYKSSHTPDLATAHQIAEHKATA